MPLTWQEELTEILRMKDGREIHLLLEELIENEKGLSFEEGKASVDSTDFQDLVDFQEYVRGM